MRVSYRRLQAMGACYEALQGIRGPQVWVGYKDYCHEDLEAFRKAIQARDPKMVEAINRECPGWKAVTGGASNG